MKKVFTTAAILLSILTLSAQMRTSYVDPIIGTNGMGHTFPGACTPFGLVQLSPDTDTIPHNVDGVYQKRAYDYCAGYQYRDSTIVGFSHTHFSGTGHSDLGDILLMPTVGRLCLRPGTAQNPDDGYRSRFSHRHECAKPGYYAVYLDDYGIRAELTATTRVGVHRYTFPKEAEEPRLILDLSHGIYNYDGKVLWSSLRVEDETTLTGYRITNGWARTHYLYFAIKLSQPIKSYGYADTHQPQYNGFWRRFDLHKNFPEMGSRGLVAYFDLDLQQGHEVTVQVALSPVSTAGALKNLEAEVGNRSFQEVASAAEKAWEKELSLFTIEGTEDQKAVFYTALYHTMINPSIYMDVDGRYRGLDGNIYQAEGFTNYTIFSLWDTYRALHPLFNIMAPERSADMVSSMLHHYQQSVHGMLPIWSHMANENWCMSGYHAVSVLADAMAKGVYPYSEEALEAMVSTSNVDYYDHLGEYKKLGYVPFDKSSTAVSTTLEYAYDDWTIYQTARAMGRDSVAAVYWNRSQNYKHVFCPETHYARPRLEDGSFKPDFNPLETYGEGFIEGNSANFSFHVPHDLHGLMQAMGGESVFLDRLERLFEESLPESFYEQHEDITKEGIIGGYVHGNEPSHHVPYLFMYTSKPWLTAYWVREIMDSMYRNEIDGLGGNDDCGQMSAWYIFSAMGFYPVAPGSQEYVLGAPYLPYLKLNLPNGKVLEIKAPKVSRENRYVRGLKVNGKPHRERTITHDEVMAGGVWEVEMSSRPSR